MEKDVFIIPRPRTQIDFPRERGSGKAGRSEGKEEMKGKTGTATESGSE